MRKFYSILAVALLALPAYADETGPVRTSQDAKEIFFQGFESDWEAWSTTAVDTIDGIDYYNTKEKPSIVAGLSLYPQRRDSIIPLYNGVKIGSDDDMAADNYKEDVSTILEDMPDDNSRQQAFEEFGTDGGKYYFKYSAGHYYGSEFSDGVSPNYRRNLFVRGLPIEDESSYRLTLYLKANSKGSTTPKFAADIMRGYFDSEKPFSMGVESDAANYKYKNTFEYTKSEFTGEWEKVTFMTYYLNDSIADQFMYTQGYWWADDWTWNISETDSLQYIRQYDKFFVRLAFNSDSTVYEIDNLSLTKSWIGGVEHYKDLLRVDFGYETNMDDLAAQAKAKTNIAAVQVPGEYFTVWGLDSELKEWFEVEIASAEYHGDGYMYMWTKDVYDEESGEFLPNEFEGYDSVLVSFKNPVDREDLCLYYNGTMFPKALDVEWIKDGKKLPDFSNEISTMNPYISKGVYSMKNLPPVVQRLPYENGSFGLDGSVRELSVYFSRKLAYDNSGENTKLALLRVTKSGVKEIWEVKESNDSCTVFVRPAKYTGDLDGEYKFEFLQLKDDNTDMGDNIICNWEFGKFDTNPDLTPVVATDWRAQGAGFKTVPVGVAVWNSVDGFFMGDNTDTSKKNRAFLLNPATSNGFDILMYFSSRGLASGGHLYYGLDSSCPLHLEAGKYNISFYCSRWDGHECPVTMYLIPRDSISDPSIQAVSDAARVAFGTFLPEANLVSNDVTSKTTSPYGPWSEQNYISLSFEVLTEGNYVIEWNSARVGSSGSNPYLYGGLAMSNFEITRNLGLSFGPVSTFNKAMIAARNKRTAAAEGSDDMYLGSDYTAFDNLIKSLEGWQHTAPSAYADSTAVLNAGTTAMQLRMDTVDLFNKTYNDVLAKLAVDSLTEFAGLAAYQALQNLASENKNYPFAQNTTAQLTAVIGQFTQGMEALDARKALNEKWTVKIGEIKAVLEDSLARKGYSEYGDLETYYKANNANDVITPTDEQLQQMYEAACLAKNGYVFRCDLVDARTRQIKELFALNDTLGATFDGCKDSLQQVIDGLMDGDDQLEAMLRAAAIWHLTEALKDKNPVVNGLNVSALVPNYYLYTTEKAFKHMTKNSSGMWVLMESSDEIYPNWYTTYKSGNSHPGTVALDSTEAHTYIAGHYLETYAVSSINTTIEGLPVGYYNAQFNVGKISGSNSYVVFKTDSTQYENKNAKVTNAQVGKDSVQVSAGSKLYAAFENRSTSSTGHFQIGSLSLILTSPDAAYDYTQAAADAQNAFNEIRSFVGDVKSVENVSYYGLNGVQMNAPKAGQIVIRKTILGNGKTVNEKILVK